jgi:hypothetical protein
MVCINVDGAIEPVETGDGPLRATLGFQLGSDARTFRSAVLN